MSNRHTADEQGSELATTPRKELGQELRVARTNAGLGQRVVAVQAGMSHHQLGRIERGGLRSVSLDQLCRAGLAVGVRFSGKFYPAGDPFRDSPQLRTLERFVALLPALALVDREAVMPITGDLRAWDALVRLGGRRAGCEVETRVKDIQALERKLGAKLRDGGVDVLLLVLSDTLHHRSLVAEQGHVLRPLLPLDNAQVRRALRLGSLPAASGVVLV